MSKKLNVLSVRITDEELAALARTSHTAAKSISDLMRDALRTIAYPPVSCYTNNGMGETRS